MLNFQMWPWKGRGDLFSNFSHKKNMRKSVIYVTYIVGFLYVILFENKALHYLLDIFVKPCVVWEERIALRSDLMGLIRRSLARR